jgi:hypothetical protein
MEENTVVAIGIATMIMGLIILALALSQYLTLTVTPNMSQDATTIVITIHQHPILALIATVPISG